MNTNLFMDCLVAVALVILLAMGMKLAGVNEPLKAFQMMETDTLHIDNDGAVWVSRSMFEAGRM